MNKFELHYGIINGGDGSAYPRFFESKELTTWDQDNMDEGWGEDCSGTIELESESLIICKEHIITKEEYFLDQLYEHKEKEKEFLEHFFPNGFPTNFIVTCDVVGQPTNKHYLYNNVFLNGKLLFGKFMEAKYSGKVYENEINSII